MTIASTMGYADRAYRAAKHRVDSLLNEIFAGRWERWRFIAGVGSRWGIDVFGVEYNREALRRLFAAGFTLAVLHNHRRSEQAVTCRCRPWEAY
jgi:hypothetical protein